MDKKRNMINSRRTTMIIDITISVTPHGCQKLGYQPFENKELEKNTKIC